MTGEVRRAGWDTFAGTHRVLALVRTVTSATRLFDVLPVFDGDERLDIRFAVVPGSVFGDGVAELLEVAGARVVPWPQARRERARLAVATSANGELHRLRTPLLVLPHGAGFNKRVRSAEGDPLNGTSGLDSSQLLHRGRVVPSAIGVSHGTELARLAASCPRALPRAVVVGDPCFDRLLASLPHRERYRRALGVHPGQRLVVVSSTWGRSSLIARRGGLPGRLLAELPADAYRVAVVLHPNVWSRHRPFEVERQLSNARAAGLIVVPPDEGWRAALVAADAVIGDHGSVTLYAAALGRPTMLGTFGAEEVVHDGPMAELRTAAPRLRDGEPLLPQLRRLEAEHDPAGHARLRERSFGHIGGSLVRLREVMYGLMELSPPSVPAPPRAVPGPAAEARPVTAFRAVTAVADAGGGRAVEVAVSRYPAAVCDDGQAGHLVVDEDEPNARWTQSAAVIVRRAWPPESGAGADPGWCERALAAYPGARVAAVVTAPGRAVILPRGGPLLYAAASPGAGGVDPAVFASAVYACLLARRMPDAEHAGLRVRLDHREMAVSCATAAPDGPGAPPLR